MMLDDLKYIHNKDKSDALGIVEKQWEQLNHVYEVSLGGFAGRKFENIVWAGMGGSAIPAQTSLSWPGYTTLPLIICRDYDIPAFVNEKTIFIAASHSGNTEETLSALDGAEQAGAAIIIIASGGKLAERAAGASYPMYKIPGGIQPRMTTWYFLRALADIYEQLGLGVGFSDELAAAAPFIKDSVTRWRPDVPVSENPTKQLAQQIAGTSVVVYSGPRLQAVANKFKIALNENAKNLAWWNQLPEFNHNEFVGWSSHPVDKPYAVVDFRSNLEHPRVQKRFEVTERMLSGKRPSPYIVAAQGETILRQMLWGMAFFDFVSIYTALLNGLDPTPVELVERFKKALNE